MRADFLHANPSFRAGMARLVASAALIAATALAGCANNKPAGPALTPSTEPGRPTVADASTRACVLRTIRAFEGTNGTSGPPVTLVSVESLGKVGETWIERWTVQSKGRQVSYSVKLRPGTEGALDYDVERLVSGK
jgi:hypothetical protein